MILRRKLFSCTATLVLLTALAGCDRDPVVPPIPVMERIDIAELRALYTGTATTVDTLVYIQGIVTLTPELNNVPDFVGYVQDNTGGITLTVTGNNTLASGSEVKISCSGLVLNEYMGLLQFGEADLSTQLELISISAGLPEPREVTIAQLLNGEYVAEYVQINDVQFEGTGTFSGSKTLSDCLHSVTVFTRSQATFASNTLPSGNGTFRGVVSAFNDPQLLVVDPSDLSMTGERCSGGSGYLSEDFESLAGNAPIENLSGWKNIPEKGSQKWKADDYTNKSAVMSAYQSNEDEVVTWMITPVMDLSASVSPVLRFQSKARYHNGAVLEVLVSTGYTGSATPWASPWTKLNPALDPGSTGGSSNWVSSGDVDLSAHKGQTYIAFRYTGGDPAGSANDLTSTWQVDNVVVTEAGK
jgi:hypothetical protein